MLFLYCVLPMQRQRVRDVWPGVLVCVLLLGLVKGSLGLYFEHLADLGALYGSLGALMALLLFVYAASIVLLFGAEFASEWSRLPRDDRDVRTELARIRRRARGAPERRAELHRRPALAVDRRPGAAPHALDDPRRDDVIEPPPTRPGRARRRRA